MTDTVTEARPKMLSLAARRYALVVLAVVYMFNFVDRQILAILLPQIRDEFGTSDTILGLLAGTAFAVFYVTLGIPIAQVADRCNRRNLIAAAVALWSVMTALSGFAANIWHLTAARIGVGIGEAGCSPPAHSMIADYFPPEQRSTAMGVYTVGISAGIMMAFIGGGWVAENVGWREAFFVVGVPGLLLAAIVRFTLQEPQRGASENRAASGDKAGVFEVIRYLLSRRSFIHMAIAAGFSSFVGYAVISFLPSFMDRSFDMQRTTLWFWLGLIFGLSGGAGFFLGGFFADRLGRGSHRRAFNFIAVTVLLSAVLNALVFTADNVISALLLFIIPAATANVFLAPVLSQAQSLVPLRMRAKTSALVLLVINVIGLVPAAFITGVISDALRPAFAEDSLRYSLLIVSSVILPWAVLHYYWAGKWIDADLARNQDPV